MSEFSAAADADAGFEIAEGGNYYREFHFFRERYFCRNHQGSYRHHEESRVLMPPARCGSRVFFLVFPAADEGFLQSHVRHL